MTVREAIKELQVGYLGDTEEIVQAKHMGIKALEEVEQYRALGTVEELKEAREKQVAKKPIEKEFYNMPHCSCPICEGGLYYEQEYCDECGQALKWE
jgi:hypothetical protein